MSGTVLMNFRDAAVLALQIQDASNLMGVSAEYEKAMRFFRGPKAEEEEKIRPEWRADREAILATFLYKMAALAFRKEPMADLGEQYIIEDKKVQVIASGNFESEATFRRDYPLFKYPDVGEYGWPRLLGAYEFAKSRRLELQFTRQLGIVHDSYRPMEGQGSSGKSETWIYGDSGGLPSFGWAHRRDGRTFIDGGLIYFGKGDSGVGAPQFSVRQETGSEGWSVHT
jgi:uncharacterized protein YihD (DUF1040 family)